MEHIVRSLNDAPELSSYIQEGYEDSPEDSEERESLPSSEAAQQDPKLLSESRPSTSHTSTNEGSNVEDQKVTPEMESRFFSPLTSNTRGNRLSMSDVADRHLRDKTDAIAYIIRNISDQCAAAVEGLNLAHNAENEDGDPIESELQPNMAHKHTQSDGDVSMHTDVSQLGANDDSVDHDSGHGESTGFLTPSNENGRSRSQTSSIPPTPDLVGGHSHHQPRSSTSMSGYSNSTAQTAQTAPGRDSMQPYLQERSHGIKIVDADDSVNDSGADVGQNEVVKKKVSGIRPMAARIVPA